MPYDELIKRLNYCRNNAAVVTDSELAEISEQAADAIEELQATVDGITAQTNMVIEETEGRSVIKFEPKWIPVTERLPELNENVLVYSAHSGLICIDANIWFDRNATHWMPLPEPPKEETE